MTSRNPENTAVIVGIGEFTDRPASGVVGLEPLRLLEAAAQAAKADLGNRAPLPIESIQLVNQWGWKYRDLDRLLAAALDLPQAATYESPVGGNMPVKLMLEAAMRIAGGDQRTVLLCGAEASSSKMTAARNKQTPDWTAEDPSVARISSADFVDPQAIRYGMKSPLEVYPLYENACRAAWQQSYAESQAESGQIGAQMAQAAARNPYAWTASAATAEEITTPAQKNRMVIHPYTKLMIANPMVNQASAVLITSLAKARAAGIAEERLVYIWSGVGGNEPQDFMARERYDQASAMDSVLQRTLAINGLHSSDLTLLELYSCFPCVPKMARRSLAVAADAPLSVTGGLVSFGAPANNYMGHAICAMTRELRSGAGRHGLLYGNGEFVTKHHAAILSSVPAPEGQSMQHLDLQAELDAGYGPVPPLLADYVGASTIETYTVMYDRDGQPEFANIVARTPASERHLARVSRDDAATLAWLTDGVQEPISQTGLAYAHSDGLTHWQQH